MSANSGRIADRHSRDVSGMAAADASHKAVVAIGIPEDLAATPAGQHAIWVLTNLLARQVGVVHRICLRVPDAPLLQGVAVWAKYQQLRDALQALVNSIAGSAISVATDDRARADIDLWIGRRDPGRPAAPVSLVLWGDGWNAYAGETDFVGDQGCDNPMGPYFAACLGAGEVFKRARGLLDGEFISSVCMSLWDGRVYPTWSAMPKGPALTGRTLPALYLVGAGAVGQAFGLVLATLRHQGYATLIDHEKVDHTNLNRYSLSTLDDADKERDKVEIVSNALKGTGIETYAYTGTWSSYVSDLARKPQRPDVAAEEEGLRFAHVVSCVDNNQARHDIQGVLPRQLIGASTDGLRAAVMDYDMLSNYHCLKCWNPLPTHKTDFAKFLVELRNMTAEARRSWAAANGFDSDALEAHLSDPRCGELSERDLVKFATAEEPAFSVGFVSVGAGVLLAARFVARVYDDAAADPSERGATLVFSFWNARSAWIREPRSDLCSCKTDRDRYRRHWS